MNTPEHIYKITRIKKANNSAYVDMDNNVDTNDWNIGKSVKRHNMFVLPLIIEEQLVGDESEIKDEGKVEPEIEIIESKEEIEPEPSIIPDAPAFESDDDTTPSEPKVETKTKIGRPLVIVPPTSIDLLHSPQSLQALAHRRRGLGFTTQEQEEIDEQEKAAKENREEEAREEEEQKATREKNIAAAKEQKQLESKIIQDTRNKINISAIPTFTSAETPSTIGTSNLGLFNRFINEYNSMINNVIKGYLTDYNAKLANGRIKINDATIFNNALPIMVHMIKLFSKVVDCVKLGKNGCFNVEKMKELFTLNGTDIRYYVTSGETKGERKTFQEKLNTFVPMHNHIIDVLKKVATDYRTPEGTFKEDIEKLTINPELVEVNK